MCVCVSLPKHFKLGEADGIPDEDSEIDGFHQCWFSGKDNKDSQNCGVFIWITFSEAGPHKQWQS